MTVVKNTGNVYHVTRQNLYFAHAPYYTPYYKWQLKSRLVIKHFDSEIIFFGLDWEEVTSHKQKHVSKTIFCAK